MATAVTLPELAENVEEARVVSVLVSVGAHVQADQAIAEVETDKATAEVPAPTGGVVQDVRVSAGQSVHVGDVLMTLEPASEEAAPSGGGASEGGAGVGEPPSETAPAPSGPPEGGQGAREAREHEAPTQAVAEIAPRSEPPSPRAAHAEQAPREREERPARSTGNGHDGQSESRQAGSARGGPLPAAPSTRRLARELGIDLEGVRGSGPNGRISESDLLAFARARLQAEPEPRPEPTPRPPAGPAGPRLPDFQRWGEVDREPLDPFRRRTAEAVATAWSQIPHVTQGDRADVTALEEMRGQLARAHANGGTPRVTMTAVLVRLTAGLLRDQMTFNSSLDLEHDELVRKRYIHIGVAVDTPRGLLVPVIRDADRKSILAVAQELGDLAERARQGRLSASEMQGGTFTITNLGGLGTTTFTPIVRWPEVAILGVGRAEERPVFRDGGFVPRRILPLSLSYDHRVIDGADAARFLRALAETLENPLRSL